MKRKLGPGASPQDTGRIVLKGSESTEAPPPIVDLGHDLEARFSDGCLVDFGIHCSVLAQKCPPCSLATTTVAPADP